MDGITPFDLQSMSRLALLASYEPENHTIQAGISGERQVICQIVNLSDAEAFRKAGWEVVPAEAATRVFMLAYRQI